MVPIEMPESMFEDPSSGSNTTQYPPLIFSSVTMMAFSFSSETMTETFPDEIRELMKMLLATTSSFLTSSPWTLTAPARPVLGID